MDATFCKRMELPEKTVPEAPDNYEILIELLDDISGDIQIVRGENYDLYTLKPLSELYGTGNAQTVDPGNDRFMPLLRTIESDIVKFDASRRRLTDAEVTLALDAMSMNPEAPSGDPLVRRLQCGLRLVLSVNDYSRQEVRQAIRKIGKSVVRHTESGRGRGYLNFCLLY